MSETQQMFGLSLSSLYLFYSAFVRTGCIVFLIPGVGENSLAIRLRLGATLSISTVVFLNTFEDHTNQSVETLGILTITGLESINGLFFGAILRFLAIILQICGAISAQSTSLSQVLGTAGADPMPAMGNIVYLAGLALIMALGFPVLAASYVISSYDLVPLGEAILPSTAADWGSEQVTKFFSLAFSLSAPFVLLSVCYSLAIGVANKAMPHLMLAFIGAPAITFAAILLLFFYAPFLLQFWLKGIEAFLIGLPSGGA